MNIQSKYRLLLFFSIILFTMNVATIGTLIYHARQERKEASAVLQEKGTTVQGEQGARYFREQLKLDPQQTDQFREINREYNRASNMLAMQLDKLRAEMVEKLGLAQPDTIRLQEISREIGQKHEELKNLTIRYYLGMKSACNDEQKEKLQIIFRGMVQKGDSVTVRQGSGRGYRWRGGRN